VMLTVGRMSTITAIAAELVTPPLLSVARAVYRCVPAATIVRDTMLGASVLVAWSVAPSKNSTLAIVPSLSEAVAAIVKLPGALNTALFGGAVMLTAGAVLTVTLTAAEVVVAPLLSVALAEYRQDRLTRLNLFQSVGP
jgi:hypothetical protein